jgi:hypothetical protein
MSIPPKIFVFYFSKRNFKEYSSRGGLEIYGSFEKKRKACLATRILPAPVMH